MNERFWLQQLPSTDPAFTPLHRAEFLSDPEDIPALQTAHRQAVLDAAWGHDMTDLERREEGLRETVARLQDRDDERDAGYIHAAEIEALGYALGVTAVRVAIREHTQHDLEAAA